MKAAKTLPLAVTGFVLDSLSHLIVFIVDARQPVAVLARSAPRPQFGSGSRSCVGLRRGMGDVALERVLAGGIGDATRPGQGWQTRLQPTRRSAPAENGPPVTVEGPWPGRMSAIAALRSCGGQRHQLSGVRGGSGGIRTHGRLSPSLVFKTSALNHSATLPNRRAVGGSYFEPDVCTRPKGQAVIEDAAW